MLSLSALRQFYALSFLIWGMGDSAEQGGEREGEEAEWGAITILEGSRAEAGAAFSPGRSQRSGNTGPAAPEAWVPLGAVAGGPLPPEWRCCCCPSGCGQGWRGAGGRVWSPRCSPPGLPRPRPAPEPPGAPARRPRAGGECALSPRRGSPRLGTGAGVRGGETAPPSEECLPALGQASHCLRVAPKFSFISSVSTQTRHNSPVRTGRSTNSFTPAFQ